MLPRQSLKELLSTTLEGGVSSSGGWGWGRWGLGGLGRYPENVLPAKWQLRDGMEAQVATT